MALHLFRNTATLKQLEVVYCCLLSWLVACSVLAVPWQIALAPVGVEKADLQLQVLLHFSHDMPTWLHAQAPFNTLRDVQLLPVWCVIQDKRERTGEKCEFVGKRVLSSPWKWGEGWRESGGGGRKSRDGRRKSRSGAAGQEGRRDPFSACCPWRSWVEQCLDQQD